MTGLDMSNVSRYQHTKKENQTQTALASIASLSLGFMVQTCRCGGCLHYGPCGNGDPEAKVSSSDKPVSCLAARYSLYFWGPFTPSSPRGPF